MKTRQQRALHDGKNYIYHDSDPLFHLTLNPNDPLLFEFYINDEGWKRRFGETKLPGALMRRGGKRQPTSHKHTWS